jgi:hypothetical protein
MWNTKSVQGRRQRPRSGGSWDFKDDVMLNGTVAPDPGRGTVRIRLDFQNQQARWQSVVIAPGGKLTWTVHAPQNSLVLNAIAWFEGSRKLGSYRSNPAAGVPGAAMMVNRLRIWDLLSRGYTSDPGNYGRKPDRIYFRETPPSISRHPLFLF